MFRAILVAIKPWGAQPEIADYAGAIAQRHGLVVDGASVIDTNRLAPPESVPIGAGTFKVHCDEERVQGARRNAVERLTQLKESCGSRGVHCETSTLDGDAADVLATAAQRSDIVMCGLAAESTARERATLSAILKRSARPAILVPTSASPGDTLLVAYDGSYQAARALAALAASGFAEGRTTYIVSLHEHVKRAEEHAVAAQTYLARHGITANVRPGPLTALAGEQILDETRRLGAGLIVMGAFGRTAAREFLFGSVTRTVLDASLVPVLLDH